ncbi:MAG: hypothetical protein AB7I27_05835 [Bacteriovoracaceae bacterium]
MSSNSITISKFLFKNEWKPLNEAINIAPVYQTSSQDSTGDLVNYLTVEPSSLVITSVSDKNDLIQLASFVKTSKKFGKEIVFKVVVVNFSASKDIEKAIQKLGILDLVDPNVTTKALRFKIDFWMKALNAQVKSQAGQTSVKNIKNTENSNSAEKKTQESQISWKEPLDVESDIWLIKSESDFKKVINKWLVKLVGPSGYVGQWVEVNGQKNLWKFDIKNQHKELYLSGDGEWYFQGDQKPEFVYKENIWLITGESFNLFFKDNSATHSRIGVKDKVLSICKNSDYAKTKEQLIIESFNQELVFKKDGESAKANDYKDEKEALQLKNLEGKGSTDQLAGNLSGKNSKDNIQSDPLKGKSSTDVNNQSHYKGDVEQKAGANSPELKAVQESSSRGNTPDFRDKEEKRTGTELSIEKDKRSEGDLLKAPTNSSTSGPLSGKTKTDQIDNGPLEGDRLEDEVERHDTYYKNHNSHVKPEANRRDPSRDGQEKKGKHGTDLHGLGEKAGQAKNPYSSQNSKKDDFGGVNYEKDIEARKQEAQKRIDELEKELSNNVVPIGAKADRQRGFSESDPELEATLESPEVLSYLSQGQIKFACKLDDHFEQTIIFTTPQNGVVVNKPVVLDLSFKYRGNFKKLSFEGDVKSINEDEDGTRYIEVEVAEEKVKEFVSFMDMYRERQKSVDTFLKRAKGY